MRRAAPTPRLASGGASVDEGGHVRCGVAAVAAAVNSDSRAHAFSISRCAGASSRDTGSSRERREVQFRRSEVLVDERRDPVGKRVAEIVNAVGEYVKPRIRQRLRKPLADASGADRIGIVPEGQSGRSDRAQLIAKIGSKINTALS